MQSQLILFSQLVLFGTFAGAVQGLELLPVAPALIIKGDPDLSTHALTGIVHKDDSVYVCDVGGRRIARLRAYDLEYQETIVTAEQDGFCDDLEFNNNNGDLVWTGLIDGYVNLLDGNTSTIRELNGGMQFGPVPPLAGVNPIAYDNDGSLWAATFIAPLIRELDYSAASLPPVNHAIIDSDAPPGVTVAPNSFDFCPNGEFFGPVDSLNRVVRILRAGPGPVTYQTLASVERPVALACASDNSLYVLERYTGKVLHMVVDLGTGLPNATISATVTEFAQGPVLADNLDLDEENGVMYVSGNLNRLYKISLADGSLITKREPDLTLAQGLALHRAPGFLQHTLLYVADFYAVMAIDIEDPDYPIVGYRETEGSAADAEFRSCQTLSVNDDYIACATRRGTVTVLDRVTFEVVDIMGQRTDADGTFGMLADVQWLPDGTFVTTEATTGKLLRVYRENGYGTDSTMFRDVVAENITIPMGLALSVDDDVLYMTTYGEDNDQGEVLSFQVSQIGSGILTPTVVAQHLDYPTGIVHMPNSLLAEILHRDEGLLVAESGGDKRYLTHVDTDNGDKDHVYRMEDETLPTHVNWSQSLPLTSFVGVVSVPTGLMSHFIFFSEQRSSMVNSASAVIRLRARDSFCDEDDHGWWRRIARC